MTIATPFDNQPSPPKFIAIEGNIGVGKTTLAKKLAETFNYETLLEQPKENPFLQRFYDQEEGAALATQLFFLFQRVKQMQGIRQNDMFQPVRVSDFLLEKDELFARVTLDEDELKLYHEVYKQVVDDIPQPDLVIYLQAPVDVLQQRISTRGLDNEQNISAAYLAKIHDLYTQFFHYYDGAPLLIVNVEDIDVVNNEDDYLGLVDYLLRIKRGRHYYNPVAQPSFV